MKRGQQTKGGPVDHGDEGPVELGFPIDLTALAQDYLLRLHPTYQRLLDFTAKLMVEKQRLEHQQQRDKFDLRMLRGSLGDFAPDSKLGSEFQLAIARDVLVDDDVAKVFLAGASASKQPHVTVAARAPISLPRLRPLRWRNLMNVLGRPPTKPN